MCQVTPPWVLGLSETAHGLAREGSSNPFLGNQTLQDLLASDRKPCRLVTCCWASQERYVQEETSCHDVNPAVVWVLGVTRSPPTQCILYGGEVTNNIVA
jgi:hypothetical protein